MKILTLVGDKLRISQELNCDFVKGNLWGGKKSKSRELWGE